MRPLRICLMKSHGTIAPRIIEDMAEALRALGQEAAVIDLEEEGYLGARGQEQLTASIRRVSAKLQAFKPDYAFSYACAGMIQLELDGNPWSNIFEALKIPYLLLLYDAPFVCRPFFERTGRSELLHVACWDKAYLEWFKQFGTGNVLHLPLGTNARVFGKAPACEEPSKRIAFVGSVPQIDIPEPQGTPLAMKAGHAFLELKTQEPCRPSSEIMEYIRKALPDEFKADLDAFLASPNYAGYMTELFSVADGRVRRALVSAVAGLGATVYGGESWRGSLPAEVELRDRVAYGPELADIYASHAVNLNISGAQLESSVNQRVFDCPAAGGFLLTDYRKELEELFDPGTEIACYKDAYELREQARSFLSDPAARRKMAAAARKRALAQHSWDVRMAKTLDWLLERRAGGGR